MMVLLLVACVLCVVVTNRVLCSCSIAFSEFSRDEPTTPKENLNLVFARGACQPIGGEE